jgi:rRNA-processing protein FCF1
VEVVLVVEGAASGLASVEGVRVVTAPRSGDDEIVAQAELGVRAGRAVWVVTADRGLRTRVTEIGARVLGPRSVPRSL